MPALTAKLFKLWVALSRSILPLATDVSKSVAPVTVNAPASVMDEAALTVKLDIEPAFKVNAPTVSTVTAPALSTCSVNASVSATSNVPVPASTIKVPIEWVLLFKSTLPLLAEVSISAVLVILNTPASVTESASVTVKLAIEPAFKVNAPTESTVTSPAPSTCKVSASVSSISTLPVPESTTKVFRLWVLVFNVIAPLPAEVSISVVPDTVKVPESETSPPAVMVNADVVVSPKSSASVSSISIAPVPASAVKVFRLCVKVSNTIAPLAVEVSKSVVPVTVNAPASVIDVASATVRFAIEPAFKVNAPTESTVTSPAPSTCNVSASASSISTAPVPASTTKVARLWVLVFNVISALPAEVSISVVPDTVKVPESDTAPPAVTVNADAVILPRSSASVSSTITVPVPAATVNTFKLCVLLLKSTLPLAVEVSISVVPVTVSAPASVTDAAALTVKLLIEPVFKVSAPTESIVTSPALSTCRVNASVSSISTAPVPDSTIKVFKL